MLRRSKYGAEIPQYAIIDGRTGERVGTEYRDRRRAQRRADRLDIEYGAIRYHVAHIDGTAFPELK